MVSILERLEPMGKENESENDYQNIIDWLNKTFGPLGLELITKMPQGNPDDAYQCPIAVVLNYGLEDWHPEDLSDTSGVAGYKGWWVGMSGIDSPRLTTTFGIPEFIQEFIQDFDSHRYPDLIDRDLMDGDYQADCFCDYCLNQQVE